MLHGQVVRDQDGDVGVIDLLASAFPDQTVVVVYDDDSTREWRYDQLEVAEGQ